MSFSHFLPCLRKNVGIGTFSICLVAVGCAHKPGNLTQKSSPETIAQVLEQNPSSEFAPIEYEHNQHVQKWIEYFTQKDRERFQRFLNRGLQYRNVVEELLTENEMPKELYYLALIESGFVTHAYSRARAVGVWQFMPGTGRRYGLEINHYVDERRDPIRATEAAAKYLKDLYNVFGSWYLAMAAYNSGENRVVRAVVKAKTRDYWDLIQTRHLPKETANYVPKFLAAMEIGEHPEKYGFEIPSSEKYPDLKAVEVPSPVHLKNIALVTGIDFETLRRVNPHLRKAITPPDSSTYEIWLPEDSVNIDPKNILSALQKHKINTRSVANIANRGRSKKQYVASTSRHFHTVRRGETLSSIASRYKISISYVKRINGLSSSRIQAGNRLRIDTASFKSNRQTAQVIRYRVRRGDNLTDIARKFGSTIKQIKYENSLNSNRVYIGQTLKISKDSI